MGVQKIAEGAYFVPSYSVQTIVWSPVGYTIQGVTFEEVPNDVDAIPYDEQGQPFTKDDFEQALRKVSRRIKK